MITAPPYSTDAEMYHRLPVEHRWIFNKLQVAETFGYLCGPAGVRPPEGRYCLRPIMNLQGGGKGGYFMVGADEAAKNLPGYFWCEWMTGAHVWTQYINGIPVRHSINPVINDRMTTQMYTNDPAKLKLVAPPLPDELKGISRYMMVERLGNKIIEVCPRMMYVNAVQEVLDDYRTIDPDYNPDVEMGNSDVVRVPLNWRTTDGRLLRGWTWGDDTLNRRDF